MTDFCCPEAGLVIEIGGPLHDGQIERDRFRDQEIAVLGYPVLRFKNDEVPALTRDIVEQIAKVLLDRTRRPRESGKAIAQEN